MKPIIINASGLDNVNDNNRDLVKFAQMIDFSELYAHLQALAKVKCQFEVPVISFNRDGSVHIGFASENIAPQTGPFSAILESCKLASFSNWVVRDKETGELRYWVDVSIQYQHVDGGSNGMSVCMAEYRKGEWSFRDAGERRQRHVRNTH